MLNKEVNCFIRVFIRGGSIRSVWMKVVDIDSWLRF